MKLIFLIILSLFAVHSFLFSGFIPTHDGEFHYVRFWQFEKMILSRDFIPSWAPDLNSGYGLPLFYYHYPLPNYFGVIFHQLGFSYTDAFELTLALFYVVAVILFYLWSKNIWATILFGWTPYWFVNLFVRGSIGEVMAMAGFAFFLWANSIKNWKLVAVSVAFIILSHNIASLLFVPIALILNWRATLVGLLMSAYFWLPAITGGSYIQGLSNFEISDHFTEVSQLLIPSWGSGFSQPGAPFDELSQQLGLGTIIVSLFTFPTSLILLLVSFLMTRGSVFIWNALPFLTFIQYPWRLLMLVPFIGGFLATRASHKVAIVSAIASLVFGLSYIRPVVYENRNDNYYLSRKEFTDGTASVGNSISTAWSPWKSERAIQKFQVLDGNAELSFKEVSPTHFVIDVRDSKEGTIRANIVYFPGWKLKQEDSWTDLEPDKEGLMRFQYPRGNNTVELKLHNTSTRTIGITISLLSFIWLIGSAILKR